MELLDMPKLGQYNWMLDTICFLYQDEKHAAEGTEFGGTGFLVAIPSNRWPEDFHHVHAVTNWHVACQGFPVIRINLAGGSGTDTFAFDCAEWIFDPNGHDVAVSPPLPLNNKKHAAEAYNKDWLLTQDEEKIEEIGAADDVFMIGRFIDYCGKATNTPSCRFGHISIADANIKVMNGYSGRSIILDMHSRNGYSGSPILVYRTAGSMFFKQSGEKKILTAGHYIKLLGMHWGQFPERWELKGSHVTRSEQAALITTGKYVEGLSGMTCVVPASMILSLLEDKQLQQMREVEEQKYMHIFQK